jgi:hypothetical protein
LWPGQDHVDPRVDQDLEEIAGVHHRGPLPARPGDRQQVVVQHEDVERRGGAELLLDPRVVDAADLALVEVGSLESTPTMRTPLTSVLHIRCPIRSSKWT